MSARQGIDEAFGVIAENLLGYTDIVGEIVDDDAGVRMEIEELAVTTPIELSLFVRDDGSIEIGCAPPLYDVDVTIQPVLHNLHFRAVVHGTEESDG